MLDAVSGGRAYLGLAKGAWLDRLGIEEGRPLVALREAVAIIRALLAGDDGGIDGERFTLVPGRSSRTRRPANRSRSRSERGGRRPRAGQVRSRTRSSSEEARIRISSRWRGTGSGIRRSGSSSDALPSSTRTPTGRASVPARSSSTTSRSWLISTRRSRQRDRRAPPLERFTIAGTPEEVADRVMELWDAGAARVELGTPQGRTPASGIDLICDRVVPLLGR